MPTNLLLLPLLGGYWFLHTWYYTRFRSQRLDGYRLLLESAMVGVAFAGIGWIAVKLASLFPPVIAFWEDAAPPIPYLGTALAAIGIGFVAPFVLNFGLSRTGLMTRIDAQRKAIERHGNHLLRVLHSAAAQERMVAIVLDNRKVYIGFVAAAPNLESHDAFFSITPFFSGYRDTTTMDLVLTVDYLRVYEREHLAPEDFNVTVPIASVRMASFFDQSAYPAFLVESGESSEDAVGPQA
jgi:hypothetical protein